MIIIRLIIIIMILILILLLLIIIQKLKKSFAGDYTGRPVAAMNEAVLRADRVWSSILLLLLLLLLTIIILIIKKKKKIMKMSNALHLAYKTDSPQARSINTRGLTGLVERYSILC